MAESGCIYILTNPSFPHFVKIGYADDVDRRLSELNRSECIPYAFRLYAYYKVNARLTDMKLHAMIDKLNPTLRSVEEFNGKTRKREFYQMSAHQAYSILETIAEINNLQENLVLVGTSQKKLDLLLKDFEAQFEGLEIKTFVCNLGNAKNRTELVVYLKENEISVTTFYICISVSCLCC